MTVPDYAPIGTVARPVTKKTEEPPQVSISPSSHIEKVTGSRHLKAAFGYSLNGALRLLRETAFRHEIITGLAIFAAFAAVGASFFDYIMMAVVMLGLFSAEALNTAIEEIIDRISPEWSDTGRHAKDLGSFAVFCMLLANGLTAAFVIIPKLISP
ncbi:diacylglycerol kinase [Rhizobium wenxiniae]|uniref:diacylglycerol kinase n=1 Tax=Rhizobium wenxiniae TaxID=1737357 RepID=UPI001C6EC6D6|nr:diacylglycerol kinase [Rhizobium wenxiniae]MBW9091169.1 diacylglycerol kinase [Rhizobium wenxiniae]